MPRDRATSRCGSVRTSDRPSEDSSTPSCARPGSTVRLGCRWCGTGSCNLLWWPKVYRMLESGPHVLGGVGAPRTPPGAVLDECPVLRGQAQLRGGNPKAEVAGGKGVRISKAAHRNHFCGPGTDPRQGQQLSARAFPVAPGVQGDASVGKPCDQRTQSPLSGLGHSQMDGIDRGELSD